jgi:hypothetical protein
MHMLESSDYELRYRLRAPAEPMPSPVREPEPMENPDVPVKEPDPETPNQI